jgi:hypothetical protein
LAAQASATPAPLASPPGRPEGAEVRGGRRPPPAPARPRHAGRHHPLGLPGMVGAVATPGLLGIEAVPRVATTACRGTKPALATSRGSSSRPLVLAVATHWRVTSGKRRRSGTRRPSPSSWACERGWRRAAPNVKALALKLEGGCGGGRRGSTAQRRETTPCSTKRSPRESGPSPSSTTAGNSRRAVFHPLARRGQRALSADGPTLGAVLAAQAMLAGFAPIAASTSAGSLALASWPPSLAPSADSVGSAAARSDQTNVCGGPGLGPRPTSRKLSSRRTTGDPGDADAGRNSDRTVPRRRCGGGGQRLCRAVEFLVADSSNPGPDPLRNASLDYTATTAADPAAAEVLALLEDPVNAMEIILGAQELAGVGRRAALAAGPKPPRRPLLRR